MDQNLVMLLLHLAILVLNAILTYLQAGTQQKLNQMHEEMRSNRANQ